MKNGLTSEAAKSMESENRTQFGSGRACLDCSKLDEIPAGGEGEIPNLCGRVGSAESFRFFGLEWMAFHMFRNCTRKWV